MSKLALYGGTPVVKRGHPLARMFIEYPFVRAFADYVGAEYAVPMGSGTAAIISCLIGAGVAPGDEVITVAHTWFCTVTSILAVNAVPVFVDVDPETFTLDPAKLEERISPRTRAVIGVSLYGHPADYDAIIEVARRHDLAIIDDACQSTGAAIGEHRLGSIADLTAFSFSGKPLSSTGGGIVTTDNRGYYERSMLGGQHPSFISAKAQSDDVWRLATTGGYGQNYRLDGKAAERAYEQLQNLDALNDWRRSNALYLTGELSKLSGIRPPIERPGVHHIYHFYTCLFDAETHGITRDEFVDALCAEGVQAMTYICMVNFIKTPSGEAFTAGPLHRRWLLQELARSGRCGPYTFPDGVRPDYSEGSLPVTERLAAMEFNIQQRWLNPPFGKKAMIRYVEAIAKVLDNADEIRDARQMAGRTRNSAFLTADESDA